MILLDLSVEGFPLREKAYPFEDVVHPIQHFLRDGTHGSQRREALACWEH